MPDGLEGVDALTDEERRVRGDRTRRAATKCNAWMPSVRPTAMVLVMIPPTVNRIRAMLRRCCETLTAGALTERTACEQQRRSGGTAAQRGDI